MLPDALRAGDKAATAKELKACCEKAENEGHRERVLEVKKYLYDNWKSIENATKYPDVIGYIHEALKKKNKNETSFTKKKEESIRKWMVKSFENLGNIPILQMSGRSSRTYLTLRAIQHGGLPYR